MPGNPTQALASMGIYIFKTSYLVRMLNADARKSGSERDFGKDILPASVAAGDRVFAFAFRDPEGNKQGYWRDVGNVDAYWRANLELTQVVPPLDVYDRSWPIWTYQEQSPPAKFVFDDPGRRGYAVDSMVSGGSIVSGASLRGSLLFPYVRVDEGAALEEVVVLPNAHIGAGARIRRAVIETGCRIPPGMKIGYDPDFDGERFEISAGGVTLVTPEMLGQKISYVR
jgi:glucose-1-phosphate adenylyltransferase